MNEQIRHELGNIRFHLLMLYLGCLGIIILIIADFN